MTSNRFPLLFAEDTALAYRPVADRKGNPKNRHDGERVGNQSPTRVSF
jgi:hypothetical protein